MKSLVFVACLVMMICVNFQTVCGRSVAKKGRPAESHRGAQEETKRRDVFIEDLIRGPGHVHHSCEIEHDVGSDCTLLGGSHSVYDACCSTTKALACKKNQQTQELQCVAVRGIQHLSSTRQNTIRYLLLKQRESLRGQILARNRARQQALKQIFESILLCD
ncbi:uncharacterized protein LOC102804972 [Saccoglossus kowalevskii]|uniref:Uncharacterized protein LOC102804972 n=1 Tax=Saccoglossus kowalevskii TaxID=10224 RepID=A0ABM0MGX0_SACKO|nr:PREDICTED: uncharacterized protein LOC102804972 [Saccoglossus kowalevskii]